MKSWCIGKPSAKFVAKMEDVLDVYARPYDPRFPVVCLDEANKALRSTPRGGQGTAPGGVAREDYEYQRNGTANIFLAVEPLAGKRSVRVTDRRAGADFARELRRLVEVEYRHAEKVVLVTDHLSTHSVNALYETFAPEIARRIASKDDLEKQTAAWEASRNRPHVKIEWHFRTTDARIKLRRLYPAYKKRQFP